MAVEAVVALLACPLFLLDFDGCVGCQVEQASYLPISSNCKLVTLLHPARVTVRYRECCIALTCSVPNQPVASGFLDDKREV